MTNTVLWVYSVGSESVFSPVVGSDGTVFVDSLGRLVSLTPSGALKLDFSEPGSALGSTPAVVQKGTIYVGCNGDGKFYALSSVNGTVKWTFDVGAFYGGAPAVGPDGTVYLAGEDGNVHAFDPASGEQKWSSETYQGIESWTCPAIGADGTVYVGRADGTVLAVRSTDGSTKWNTELLSLELTSPAIGTDGTVYVTSFSGRTVYALDPANGSEKWSFAPSDSPMRRRYIRNFEVMGPAISRDGILYFGSWDHNLYAVRATDGVLKWRYRTGGEVWSSPSIGADGTVYFGSSDGKVYALSPTEGRLVWSFDTGRGISASPAITDGRLYITNWDGKVYCFRD